MIQKLLLGAFWIISITLPSYGFLPLLAFLFTVGWLVNSFVETHSPHEDVPDNDEATAKRLGVLL